MKASYISDLINAISMKAAARSVSKHTSIRINVFTSSIFPLRCIMRQSSQMLSENATEYARNSIHVNGKMNKMSKTRIGGGCVDAVILCAAIAVPVLCITKTPKRGPTKGTNNTRLIMKLFVKIVNPPESKDMFCMPCWVSLSWSSSDCASSGLSGVMTPETAIMNRRRNVAPIARSLFLREEDFLQKLRANSTTPRAFLRFRVNLQGSEASRTWV